MLVPHYYFVKPVYGQTSLNIMLKNSKGNGISDDVQGQKVKGRRQEGKTDRRDCRRRWVEWRSCDWRLWEGWTPTTGHGTPPSTHILHRPSDAQFTNVGPCSIQIRSRGAWPLITGSIARSANLPVCNVLRGLFWGFSPRRGDMLHRCGWNLTWRRGHSSMPNFTPISATTRV